MTPTVLPVAKGVFLCDDVLEDRSNRKIHLLGLFNAARPQDGTAYPFRLDRLCVFAQLIGGAGDVPAHVEVVQADTEGLVYASPTQRLRFPGRHTTISALFRIRNLVFLDPGQYIVEFYCHDNFLDDRVLHLLPAERGQP